MAEQKLTPTQKLKLAEAEVIKLKKAIMDLQDEHLKQLNKELSRVQEQQWQAGYDEGFTEGKNLAAVARAEAGITRFFRK